MKLSRKKLRQLIEAFISGPSGTKHIPDEDYPYSKLEKQLGGDSDMAYRMQAFAHGDKESQKQFGEFSDALGIEDDYIGDTQEMYGQYDHDAYQSLLSKVKNIVQQIGGMKFSAGRGKYGAGPYMDVKTDSLQDAQRYVQEIKQQGLGTYLSYANSGKAAKAAHQGTYVVDYGKSRGPTDIFGNPIRAKGLAYHPRYEVSLKLKDPNWWKGYHGFPS